MNYEGQWVIRSQLDIKRKTCDIRTFEKKTFISRHILHQHWYTLPVRRNPQHRSLLTAVSATSAPPFQPLPHQRNFCHVSRPSCESPIVNRICFFMNIVCIKSFCPQQKHSRTLHFGSILLKHGRPLDYWNQPLNMLMRVCYLNSFEAGLCCYLVIHIQNLLTSITAVLLPLVTHLLILPRTLLWRCDYGCSCVPKRLV
jgi:hypothetical protein